MLLRDSHLTFGEIADRWARENADHPGALSRDQILDQLKKALRRGEFDFATLTVGAAPRDVLVDSSPGGPPTYVRVGPSWLVVTRDILDKMFFRSVAKLDKKVWLEGLRISKDDFGWWCDEQGQRRPRFWFEDDRQAGTGRSDDTEHGLDPTRSGLTGRPTPKHLYLKEMKRRAEHGLLQGKIAQEARDLWDCMDQKHPTLNPGRVKSIENAIRADYRDLQADKASEATADGIK